MLLEDLVPEPQGSHKFLYKKLVPTPGVGGIDCYRYVVVKYEGMLGDPRTPGIITSFNSPGGG